MKILQGFWRFVNRIVTRDNYTPTKAKVNRTTQKSQHTRVVLVNCQGELRVVGVAR